MSLSVNDLRYKEREDDKHGAARSEVLTSAHEGRIGGLIGHIALVAIDEHLLQM